MSWDGRARCERRPLRPVTSGAWVEITLPASLLGTGDGTVDLTLTPLSSTALRLDSRESSYPPQLVVSR